MAKPQSHQKTAQFYFALGHPRRLRIIETLKEHPKGLVCEDIERRARIPRSSLGHHLRFLKDANIVSRTIKDRYSLYCLNPRQLAEMLGHQPYPVDDITEIQPALRALP